MVLSTPFVVLIYKPKNTLIRTPTVTRCCWQHDFVVSLIKINFSVTSNIQPLLSKGQVPAKIRS